MLDSIPESHRAAVRRALDESFCGSPVSALTPLTGGRSGALVYRVDVEDASYVLRIVTVRNALNDPERQFAAMRIAANDGIAPPVIYADAASGVAITTFIRAVPWQQAFNGDTGRVAELGRCVRRLHDGPALPAFLDAFQCIEQGLAVLSSAGATLPPMLVRYLEQFVAVRSALRPHFVLGASHNDMNPGNLLYDGERPWIIDWESAWQNDPMFDVATMLHWFGFAGIKEAALLQGYFGDVPTPLQRAKLELMKQVVACYYAIVMLLLSLQRGELPPPLDPDPETLPSFADTRMMIREGTLMENSAADRVRLGLVMINDARRVMAEPRFAEAMELLQR